MTTRLRALIPAKLAENSLTTQYTVDVLNASIDKFTATNTGNGNATLSVHIVPNGGTADTSNQIIRNEIILAGEEYTGFEVIGHYLSQGDSIVTQCNTNTVNIMASGREIS